MKRVGLTGFWLMLGAAWFGVGGCTPPSAVTGRNKNPPVVLTLDPKVRKAIATVGIGDEVKFVLPATRGPGYLWQIVGNDPRCLRQDSRIVATADTATASFIAQRPSRSYVRFAYVPATGANELELVQSYEILVTVKP